LETKPASKKSRACILINYQHTAKSRAINIMSAMKKQAFG